MGHGQGERGGTMKAAETPWAILSTMIQVSAMEVVVVAPHNPDETAKSTTPALTTSRWPTTSATRPPRAKTAARAFR